MAWFLMALQKYAQFTGRSRRKEYWMFTLFNLLVYLALTTVAGLIGPRFALAVGGVYMLALLLPGLAVAVRRLHDTGRSGLWLLLGLVPVVGGLVLLYFFVQDSEPGENQFGSNPKGEGALAYA